MPESRGRGKVWQFAEGLAHTGGNQNNYVSLNLVHPGRFNRRGRREVCHARPHDAVLDHCARHHRLDCRRSRDPSIYPAVKSPLSSGRPHLLLARRDPRSVCLLQTEDSFPDRTVMGSDAEAVIGYWGFVIGGQGAGGRAFSLERKLGQMC